MEKLKIACNQIVSRLPAVKGKGEQATKQALVIPLLDALDYDIWNPLEVCPEFDADFAIKKYGQKEKVDIAILLNGSPRIFVEVKPIDESLDKNEGQLARYFNSSPNVSLGILTNGVEWRFFTDTGSPNIMDAQPFYISRLDAIDQGLDVMLRFSKNVFCPEAIRDYATELLYTAKIADMLRNELDLKDQDPSEYFIRWVLKGEKIYDGIVNGNVVDRFKPIIKDALTRVVRDIVRRSLSAMEKEAASTSTPSAKPNQELPPVSAENQPATPPMDLLPTGLDVEQTSRIITTERELQAFAIIKDIIAQSPLSAAMICDPPGTRKEVPAEISYKDTTAYFGVYLNKPGWWFVRIVLEAKTNWIGFDMVPEAASAFLPQGTTVLPPSAFSRFRISIQNPEDILQYKDLIIAAARMVIDDKKAK